MEAKEMVLKMAEILDKKGALDICVLEVSHMTSITDYFLIASGRNVQSVQTLAEDLEDRMAEEGITPRRRDGMHILQMALPDRPQSDKANFHINSHSLNLLPLNLLTL